MIRYVHLMAITTYNLQLNMNFQLDQLLIFSEIPNSLLREKKNYPDTRLVLENSRTPAPNHLSQHNPFKIEGKNSHSNYKAHVLSRAPSRTNSSTPSVLSTRPGHIRRKLPSAKSQPPASGMNIHGKIWRLRVLRSPAVPGH